MNDLEAAQTRQGIKVLGDLFNGAVAILGRLTPEESDAIIHAALHNVPHRTQLSKVLKRAVAGRRVFLASGDRRAA